jgi:hypothetical protein
MSLPRVSIAQVICARDANSHNPRSKDQPKHDKSYTPEIDERMQFMFVIFYRWVLPYMESDEKSSIAGRIRVC